MLKLIQTLEKPVHGYWDGGARQRFEWTIDGRPQQDNRGMFVRIGSWGANHWFNVAVGKTDKVTLCNAKKHLRGTKIGRASRFEYADD
jgi:hypothetical protein